MIRCVVVDDEVNARNGICEYISEVPFLKPAGVFDSPVKSLKVLKDVDLMFLDIQMPGIDRLSFGKTLKIPETTTMIKEIKAMKRSGTVAIGLWIIISLSPLTGFTQHSLKLAHKHFFSISVPNADTSSYWYEKVFGVTLAKEVRTPDGNIHVRILDSQDLVVEILENKMAKSRQECFASAPASPSMTFGFFKMGFYVEDINDAIQYLKKHGISIKNGPFRDDEIKVVSFVVSDVDGNLLQFIQTLH